MKIHHKRTHNFSLILRNRTRNLSHKLLLCNTVRMGCRIADTVLDGLLAGLSFDGM